MTTAVPVPSARYGGGITRRIRQARFFMSALVSQQRAPILETSVAGNAGREETPQSRGLGQPRSCLSLAWFTLLTNNRLEARVQRL